MSYGYRLNAEDVFFELAEAKFAEASAAQGMVHHETAAGADASFTGFPTAAGLAAAAIAVVGWAAAVEAFTNSAWAKTIGPNYATAQQREEAIRKGSTIKKAGDVLSVFHIDASKCGWSSDLRKLFEMRNHLMHYKQTVEYQGFCFAPSVSIRLSFKAVASVRSAAIEVIRELGQACDLRCSFLDGIYQITDDFA